MDGTERHDIPTVGFRCHGRLPLDAVIGMGGRFDRDLAGSLNRRDGYAPEEHSVGRLVVYPGLDGRMGKIHLTDGIGIGDTGAWDASLHRLRTHCGMEDRSYRFFALDATAILRPGEPDLATAAAEGVLCRRCFPRG